MKQTFTKISVFTIILIIVTSCSVVKRVKNTDHLLTKSSVSINGKKVKNEEINSLILQKPNNKLLTYPLRLHIYNLARENRDSLFEIWLDKKPKRRARITDTTSKEEIEKIKKSALGFNGWLRKTGEAPVIIDSSKIKRSLSRLEGYHLRKGWFHAEASYKITVDPKKKKRASIAYEVETGDPTFIDTVTTNISSPIIDSLYQKTKNNSKLISGKQWSAADLEEERDRLVNEFRNSGVYHFSQDYIQIDTDTIDSVVKAPVEIEIKDRVIRNEDSVTRVPFKTYKIKDINIITDDSFENRSKKFQDSVIYDNYTLYSYGKLRFRPKAITDAIFISKDSVFKDSDRASTYRFLNQLNTFQYPNITYNENVQDTTLTANIYLTPRKKYKLGFEPTISQNDIQSLGFAFNASLSILNVFRGAETLQLSALGNIGASKDGSGVDDQFFDINEVGINAQLRIPRFFFPINTGKIIPKNFSPSTNITLAFTSQTNIGLDRQTFNGVFNYNWKPRSVVKNSFDLFNIQFVRNLNPDNYFNVFQNSFSRLEDIALNTFNTPAEFINVDIDGNRTLIQERTVDFITLASQDLNFQNSNPNDFQIVNNIRERRERLIENNLILASSFEYSKDNRESTTDENFSIFKTRLELSGNVISAVSDLFGFNGNDIFGVEYSQYARAELDYIKRWSLGGNNVLAIRNYVGLAIPYGNSTSIPFTRSFFAGGVNDNRAWTAFDLGPGSSSSNDEFNEANFKLAFSIENRFNLFGSLKGALFVDAGNIFNVLDEVDDPASTFTNFKDLEDIAIGSGFGLRYDFGFFILRGDVGFKTYDPSFGDSNRWFNEYNFGNAVYNIGINYPF
ncbi:outer membrane protein assembly factor [Flavobacteriaceae bacterium AU392]|nr:outer membrane protein assembly factor [Flavobacteriaceae bacterium]RKM82692.1 outer membrane protein assembly factor [Flavobacteriaceae bacterium AU392]